MFFINSEGILSFLGPHCWKIVVHNFTSICIMLHLCILQVVAVCGPNNGAALAVGIWAVDKNQATLNGFKGRGIHIYQV